MSYPQPLASQEVIEGQEFFRLYTTLDSAGDVYEMNVSAKAFVIGPQSDISKVRITYWDPQIPGNVQSFVVSIDDPFIGRIDSFASTTFPLANVPAHILISSEDFFTFWQPSVLAQDIVARVNPSIDLISYLYAPTAVPPKRADFIQKGRLTIAAGGSNLTTLLYPYFRRKYASLQITNFPALPGYTVSVTGLVFTPDGPAPGTVPADIDAAKVQMTPIITAGAIPATNTTSSFEVKASTNGLFDYLMIQFSGPAIDGAAVQQTIDYSIRTTDEEI